MQSKIDKLSIFTDFFGLNDIALAAGIRGGIVLYCLKNK